MERAGKERPKAPMQGRGEGGEERRGRAGGGGPSGHPSQAWTRKRSVRRRTDRRMHEEDQACTHRKERYSSLKREKVCDLRQHRWASRSHESQRHTADLPSLRDQGQASPSRRGGHGRGTAVTGGAGQGHRFRDLASRVVAAANGTAPGAQTRGEETPKCSRCSRGRREETGHSAGGQTCPSAGRGVLAQYSACDKPPRCTIQIPNVCVRQLCPVQLGSRGAGRGEQGRGVRAGRTSGRKAPAEGRGAGARGGRGGPSGGQVGRTALPCTTSAR